MAVFRVEKTKDFTLPKPLVRPAQPNTRFASVRLHGA